MTDVEGASLAATVRTRRKALQLNQRSSPTSPAFSTRFLSALEDGKPSVQLDKGAAGAVGAGVAVRDHRGGRRLVSRLMTEPMDFETLRTVVGRRVQGGFPAAT